MKKNGFTLIELLAVIAILAILVVLAVPTVLKIFNEAKRKTFEVEAQNILKAAQDGYATSVIKTGNVEETTYTYDEEGDITTEGNIEIYLTGRKIKNGTIKITPTGNISFAISDGKYCAVKSEETEEITVNTNIEECTLEIPIEYTPDECFGFEYSGFIYYNGVSENCSSDVVIPPTINGETVEGIVGYGFGNMGITSVIFPSSVLYIQDQAFLENNIDNLTIPSNIIEIGEYAFENNGITLLTIENGVQSIYRRAFNSNSIASIVIPASVTSIGSNAFANNPITDITILGDNPQRFNSSWTNIGFPIELIQ